jgi:hypothetical protein
VAGEAPSPPKGSRTRVYSVALVVAVVTVVALAVLLPAIYNRNPLPPAPPLAGPNVQLDDYASGPTWAGQYGDDPTVAVAPNGTVAVAWEGFDEISPPPSPSSAPAAYNNAIFVSFSGDGGQHYSAPFFVGAPGTDAAFTPALAFAPNGTLFVAYDNATNTENEQIVVAAETDGKNFTPGVIAEQGQLVDSPWLAVLPNGELVLAFQYSGFVEWASSTNGGRTFGAPTILLEGVFTAGTVRPPAEVTLVGISSDSAFPTPISMWSVTFNALTVGPSLLGTGATTVVPYIPFDLMLPNLSRPGPTVTSLGSELYLFYTANNETELAMQISSTNGSTWAGPYILWNPHNTTIETPVVEAAPDADFLVLAWESTQGGFWKTYSAVYNAQTGLLSSPVTVSDEDGFSAKVRNWHGHSMGLATTGSTRFAVVWGDGRGLTGTFGLTHVYASTLTASF